MKFKLMLVFSLMLAACATEQTVPTEAVHPRPRLEFFDVVRFDHELSSSLAAGELGKVEVSFYDKFSPNAVPERLQKWLTTVENSGGRIQIESPPDEMTPRNPLMLLSMFGSLFNGGSKVLSKMQQDRMYDTAKVRDAVISLERTAKGEVVVGKIVFIKRAH